MKKYLTGAGVLLVAVIGIGLMGQTEPAVNAPALSGKLGEAVALFDGKSLSGWVWVSKVPKVPAGATTAPATPKLEEVWSVADGMMHTKGKPFTGYVRTEKEYDNYVLTVEQRHVAKGNGGVLFAINGEDKVWPKCLEVQGQNGEEGDVRNPVNYKMTMDPARLDPPAVPKRLKRISDAEKPAGEWETVEITVDHGNLTVKLNGTVVNLATGTESLKGKIGLQSEGGEMEFRKVELRPIE